MGRPGIPYLTRACNHPGSLKITFRGEQAGYEWRNGRAVECGGLENRCSATAEPGVRIPLSPPKLNAN